MDVKFKGIMGDSFFCMKCKQWMASTKAHNESVCRTCYAIYWLNYTGKIKR